MLRPPLRQRLPALARTLAALAAATAIGACPASADVQGLSFDGAFEAGLSGWSAAGGGPQCANYGTPSSAPRARGSLLIDPTTQVAGVQAARFDLPASQDGYPLQACEITDMRSEPLGTDAYYGFMFYVPPGWTDGTVQPGGFWGITTAQFHFQNIWGSPIEFELHSDHMTLALQTGACNNYLTPDPGCQWQSNADNPSGDPGNLGADYVVPPPMQQGVWHEVIMHVVWAADATGQIQVWHRVEGDPNWTETASLSGYPTVQWDAAVGCCASNVADKIGAYRGPSDAPVSVWEDNAVIGSSFPAVAATMPASVGAPVLVPPGATQTTPAAPPAPATTTPPAPAATGPTGAGRRHGAGHRLSRRRARQAHDASRRRRVHRHGI